MRDSDLANFTFKNGTYNLSSDIANATGNTTSFADATVNSTGTAAFSGNYALNNTSIVTGFGTSTISTLGENFNSKYTSWVAQAGNNNIKAVAALLDTTQWTAYKSDDAVWAVGAPTLEMFVASYNATHSSGNVSSYNFCSFIIL